MIKRAQILSDGQVAGIFTQFDKHHFEFIYLKEYQGMPVSLTLPLRVEAYVFNEFPPFFEGLLPEGLMLEALLRKYKIDKNDLFEQLVVTGQDVIGNVSVVAIP